MHNRIGVDLHVVDGKYQGSRTHVLELFSHAIRLSPDLEFLLFLENTDWLQKFSPAFSAPNVHLVKMPHANPLRRLMYQLPYLQARHRLDILHTQYIMPLPSLSACMVTIHDVLFETHPTYFNKFFRFRSSVLMRYAARHAAHVFTVSEYSKQTMVERYKLSTDKISVIHNAADTQRFCPGINGQDVIARRGLRSKEYILSVGRLEPRKNHSTLLKAYARLGNNVPRLVIVGQRDFRFNEIFDVVADLGLQNRVSFIEDASDEELPTLYRHACLFVYPAFAEGFGMPPLEALACGIPVIAANTTSIPEVIGEAGILIDPHSEQALAQAMQQILQDKALSARLGERGIARAQQFNWRHSAYTLCARYRNYLGLSQAQRAEEFPHAS